MYASIYRKSFAYPYAKFLPYIQEEFCIPIRKNINYLLLAYLEMYSGYGVAVQVTVMQQQHPTFISKPKLVILQLIGIKVKKQGWLSTPADILRQVFSFGLAFHISAVLQSIKNRMMSCLVPYKYPHVTTYIGHFLALINTCRMMSTSSSPDHRHKKKKHHRHHRQSSPDDLPNITEMSLIAHQGLIVAEFKAVHLNICTVSDCSSGVFKPAHRRR